NAMVESSTSTLGRFAGHALAGRALLRLDRVEEAKAQLSLAEREMGHLPVAALSSFPDAAMLHGGILLREQKLPQARAALKQVEQQVRAQPGPDAWNGALFELESIARAAREGNDWELAAFTAQQMLEHDPSYAGSHFAAALAAEHANDASTAAKEFAAAAKLWAGADAALPELAQAGASMQRSGR